MKNKNNSVVIILMGLIIAILAVVCVLFATGKISLKNNDECIDDGILNNKEDENKLEENNNSTNDNNEKIKYFYDLDELKFNKQDSDKDIDDISKNANYQEKIRFSNDYSVALTLSGDVQVSYADSTKQNTGKLNVNKVIDIIEFNTVSMEEEQLLYVLAENGDVYKYRIGDAKSEKYIATKVDGVSKVKKLFISHNSKPNAGGWWTLYAITSDNECITLNSESV